METREQMLIEHVNLSASASKRRAQSSSDDVHSKTEKNLVNEEVLIRQANLARSGKPQEKSKSLGHSPGLGLYTEYDSTDNEEVFAHDRKKPEKDLKVDEKDAKEIHRESDSPTNSQPDKEKDHLEVPKKTENNTATAEESAVPKLDIASTRDDSVVDEPDGYRTPRNSVTEEVLREYSARKNASEDNVDDIPTDIYFDDLVFDTAKEISINDFDEINKRLCYTNGIRDCLDVDRDSPYTFFRKLRRCRFLSRDNLGFLQDVLQILDKPSLHQAAVHYTRQSWDTIFFYQHPTTCPNGFETVKVHWRGSDFTRFRRMDLEGIRTALSSVLFLPRGSLYITGIEPVLIGGVVVAIMIPESLLEHLESLVMRGHVRMLEHSGIDALEIFGTTMDLRGFKSDTRKMEGDHTTFLTVYQQLRESKQLLEERDKEVARLKRDTEFQRLELETMCAELDALTDKARHDSLEQARAAIMSRARSPGPSRLNVERSRSAIRSSSEKAKPSAVMEAVYRPLARRHRGRSVDRKPDSYRFGSYSSSSSITVGSHSHSGGSFVTAKSKKTEEFLYEVGRRYKNLHGQDQLFREIEGLIHQIAGSNVAI